MGTASAVMSEDWTQICRTDATLMCQLTDGSNTEHTSPQSISLLPHLIYYGNYVHVWVF